MAWLGDGLRILLTGLLLVPVTAMAGPPCPTPGERAAVPVDAARWNQLLLACVAPLQHPRGDRWPLVLWHGPQWPGVSDAELEAFAARGLVPTVRLDTADIPRALRLQRLGLPVIVQQGQRRDWPYDLADQTDPAWLDKPGKGIRQPDPLRLDLWARGAARLRDVLRAFRAAGVRIDAAWLDFEGQPSLLDYQTLLASPRARARVPAAALASPAAFHAWRRQLWIQLMSAYVAGPIREFYPAASVGNWIAVLSSPGRPVLSWDGWRQPDLSASLFTATVPVAYGIDVAFRALWPADRPSEAAAVDGAYLHLLLRQVSADAANRARKAPYLTAVPWVARRVRDLAGQDTPEMSRVAYREALRHLWLRGIAGMQVFNPLAADHPGRALAEVQDARAVYDELLAWRGLLTDGRVMNFRYPGPDDQGLLWSGLRDDQRALVRLYPMGGQAPKWLRLTVWPGQTALLPVLPGGASYLVERGAADGEPRVRPLHSTP